MLAKPEKMKIVGDFKKSNDHMMALLVDACTTAAEALKAAREAESDGERWRHLGAGVGALRSMLRPKPETLAFYTEIDYYLRHDGRLRWTAEPVSGSGNVFHTPPEAMEFVLSNPPMGDLPPGADGVEPHAEPIDPSAPKMVRGWPEAYDIPELGISWRRFYTPKYVHIIAAWNNGQDAHVYQMTVRPCPLASGERWHVDVTNDGGTVFTMESNSKCLAERCGLSAMRAYIIRGHRKTWRRVHAAEDATGSVPPISPEEAAAAAEPQREGS